MGQGPAASRYPPGQDRPGPQQPQHRAQEGGRQQVDGQIGVLVGHRRGADQPRGPQDHGRQTDEAGAALSALAGAAQRPEVGPSRAPPGHGRRPRRGHDDGEDRVDRRAQQVGVVEATRLQCDLRGQRDQGKVEGHARQGADEGGRPDLQGRGAGDLLGRGPDEAQRGEALGPLCRPQIRDDPDEQQRGHEHRDGADDRGDPIRLVLVGDALEGGDHLGRDVELGGGHGPQVRPDDGHQRVRSLDGLGGQDPYLLAVAVAELVGG